MSRKGVVVFGAWGSQLDGVVSRAWGGASAGAPASAPASAESTLARTHPYFTALKGESAFVEAPGDAATDRFACYGEWDVDSTMEVNKIPVVYTSAATCSVRLYFAPEHVVAKMEPAELAHLRGPTPTKTSKKLGLDSLDRDDYREFMREDKIEEDVRRRLDRGEIELGEDAQRLMGGIVTFYGDASSVRRVMRDLNALEHHVSPDRAFAWGAPPGTVLTLLHHVVVCYPGGPARDLVFLPRPYENERAETVLGLYDDVLYVSGCRGREEENRWWFAHKTRPMVIANDQRLSKTTFVSLGNRAAPLDPHALKMHARRFMERFNVSPGRFVPEMGVNCFDATDPKMAETVAALLEWTPTMDLRIADATDEWTWGVRSRTGEIKFLVHPSTTAVEMDRRFRKHEVWGLLQIYELFASKEEAAKVYYSSEFKAKIAELCDKHFALVPGYDYKTTDAVYDRYWSSDCTDADRERYKKLVPPRTHAETVKAVDDFKAELATHLRNLPPLPNPFEQVVRASGSGSGAVSPAKRVRMVE